MSFISESQLRNQRRSIKTFQNLSESLKSYKNESTTYKTKIFLSHKHDEGEKLEGAISLLKNFGVDVYVDWLDEGMPKKTSGQTAVRIKQKIKENHKFILLATEEAINSKWCNWELGLGDAEKYIEHIAILPIEKDHISFSGSEYLQIYPYIYQIDYAQTFKGTYRSSGTYVVYPEINGNNKVIPISEWLRNR
ncbi:MULTISPECIES: toll/interleukin-1 receptor domain-containing protein [Flavobacterium]|uniref:toll/interleukin-1 receptor domain-containing protein n=1 Tax=Flavobacterium TaxID=237 RepID=UPI000DAD3AE6|nr:MULTISPECIES: toll/interleukin-1 receptor domain-containing protein [Flavobacterium]KAF2341767.1 TIR domain-containing protein [Flavobacterium tistrianum]URM38586.1 toll/interleukin-1 receptor domain-containing protein [Flavobacterium anhuiense]